MSESVRLPALGESVTEGTITRWLKQVGDRVEVDEPLLEVSTDKVDTEIPSTVAGVIEAILVQEDETVEVGTTLLMIGNSSRANETAPSPAEAVSPTQPVAPPPYLAGVQETDTSGDLRKNHVSPDVTPAALPPRPGRTVPMTRLRKVVAERAVVSMTSTAQVTTVVEVDVTRVAHLRNEVKGGFLAKTGTKLSFLPFFALAAAEALRAHPIVNSVVDGDNIIYPAREDMGIAVDTERGLLAPVLRDAAEFDIAGLAAQIADLAERARSNRLKPDELSGATFTITNTGSRGALFDTPIVFLPQSAILGTGTVVKRPVVVSIDGEEAIAMRSMVYLALSYDHRIIDGADAARYLGAVKMRLEEGAFKSNLGM